MVEQLVRAQHVALFRKEATGHHSDRLHGSVNIAIPVAWQAIGLLLLVILFVTGIFLTFASYARVETVPGAIALDTGVARIVSTRAGVIQTIGVTEGEPVQAGQRLAVVRVEESLIGGKTAPDRIREALKNQDAQLAEQGKLLLEASAAEQQRLRAQIDGDRAAIASLGSQIADQKQLINAADSAYRVAISVADRGFVSKMDLEERRTTLLNRRQQLAQLLQTLSDKQADIAQAQWSMSQSERSARASAASALSNRGSVSQQEAEADLTQGYALTAPVSGTVTALTARPGQPVTSDQQLMMVVPKQAKSRVELYVPTSAAGFVGPGQEVRLSVDAFPYQTFGTIKGRILTVSQAAITRDGPNGPTPVYLVTAEIPEPWVSAFGRREPLLPGMTLSARIITEKRSLIEWLFEPLFAVRKR